MSADIVNLRRARKAKTRADVQWKAKSDRVRKKHLGIDTPKSSLTHPTLKRKMDGTVVDRKTGKPWG